jgi:type I site-specific restriction-modification system R (restriction) subunit
MPLSTTDRKPVTSPSMINPQLQAYFASQQQQQQSQSSSSLFPSNIVNDPAIVYQKQPQSQIQRSISVTNQQPLFDDIQRSFRQVSSQPNTSSFFGTNVSNSQSQQPDDIMTRLAQAMHNHGQQQHEKVEEHRRLEQQRREIELERLKLAQQAEQLRLQREEDERNQLEQQQQQQRLEEELRKKKEAAANKQNLFDQMKEMAKTMDQKKQQQPQQSQSQSQSVKPQAKVEIDPFLAFQQSVQFQKEQQAKIETQK